METTQTPLGRGRPQITETMTMSIRLPVDVVHALRSAALGKPWGETGRILARALRRELGIDGPIAPPE